MKFLNKKTILAFHQDLVETYGGSPGIRDEGLLESAIAQLQASFGGEYVHENVFHMAAAYGFLICKDHPIFDGNKRTALVAMYTFLHVNGYRLKTDKKSFYAVVIDLANGSINKEELAEYLKENSIKRS